jgi:hypothetical protein
MHLAAKLQFERVVREYSQWRSIPEDERSPVPAWWWQPAFQVVEQHKEMPEVSVFASSFRWARLTQLAPPCS